MARNLLGKWCPGPPERVKAMQTPNRAPRILAIDDDADTLVAIAEALADTGFTLLTASDGERGLEMAVEHAPDLIISDIVMPGMDGWTLVKRVRCQPRLALVPFIFLTAAADDDEDRLRGFQLGADDFVSKPLRPGDLACRVRGSLRRQARIVGEVRQHLQASDPRPDQVGIRGALEHISLPALLTLLEMERKTGVLSLLRPEPPQEAALYIRDGRLLDAQLSGRRPRRHAEAVYDLLRWHTSRYEFVARPLEFSDQIGLSTAELLLEGARRIDGAATSSER